MQTKTMSILCALFIVGLTVFAAAEVTAEGQFPAASYSRECTLKGLSGSSVKIVAGPCLSGETCVTNPNLSDTFPITAPCPSGFGSGLCRKWQYRWTFTSMQGLTAGVSVDSDVAVLKAESVPSTTAQAVPLLPFFGEGERFIKFNLPKLTTFTGSYWTRPDVGPGRLTAGYIGTKGVGHCALPGADSPLVVPDQNVAVITSKVIELNTARQTVCNYNVTTDGSREERIVSMTLVPAGSELPGSEPSDPDCPETTELGTLSVGGKAAVFLNGLTEIRAPGSTRYCGPSVTTGKVVCVKLPPLP